MHSAALLTLLAHHGFAQEVLHRAQQIAAELAALALDAIQCAPFQHASKE